MKRRIKISLGQLRQILSQSETRPQQSITIIMNGIDREELKEVMRILKAKKKG